MGKTLERSEPNHPLGQSGSPKKLGGQFLVVFFKSKQKEEEEEERENEKEEKEISSSSL
jgi:hypothetical protein